MDPYSPVAIAERVAFEVRCENGAVYYLDLPASELASRSEFSAALVSGPTSGMKDATIVNARGDSEHVGVLVSYLLKGRLPTFLGVTDAIAILELADFYGSDALVAHCISWLRYEVSEDTALRVLLTVTHVAAVGGASRAAMRAATLLGRALGVVMHTPEFLGLDEGDVQCVLCHPAMVPLVKQLRLLAWLAWAAHGDRELPPAATAGCFGGLPLTVVSAMLQRADVQESKDLVGALGAGLGVEPRIGTRSNEIDFALLVFDVRGRVFAIDMRTRETHEMPSIARAAWGRAVAAVYDHDTETAFVFGLDGPVEPYEYFPESGFSRRIPTPDEPKQNAAYVSHDGYVYCTGGSTGEEERTKTVERMSTAAGGRWAPCAPMLVARSSHDAALVCGAHGACIVAVGGTEGPSWASVERMDLAMCEWSECEVAAPQMHGRSVAVVQGDAFVVGGSRHELRGAVVFDVECGTWSEVDGIASAPLQRAVTVDDGETSRVWVFDECQCEGPNVQVYDPVTRAREDLRVPEYTRGAAVVFVPRASPRR